MTMEIRPIQNDEDHAAALAEIDRLMDAEANTPEGARLDALVTLVNAYEDVHFPIPEVDPINMIEFVMEQQELTRADLIPMIGSRARVSEILGRRRALTLPMIRRLAKGLGIPADLLVREYPLAKAA